VSEHVSPEGTSARQATLGQNAWFAEEKYQQFLVDPASVDPSWRVLFADEAPLPVTSNDHPVGSETEVLPPDHANGHDVPGAAVTPAAPPEAEAAASETGPSAESVAPRTVAGAEPASAPEAPTPLRGAAARVVENMVASLSVPTATSVHPLPAKVLEANRRLLNDQLAGISDRKVSFTHLIAYAVVRALRDVPVLNSSFIGDLDGNGTPGVVHHEHVNLGIAIDLERRSGERSLVVPSVKAADTLGFAAFVDAYEDLVSRSRQAKLTVEDLTGTTLTITNPGTLGTTQSVPRLMVGQGAIIGVGAVDFPMEYQGNDPETLSSLGIGKVLTLTSTYDHRIIQGAESGLFLKRTHELLVGEHGFYEEVFAALDVPWPPLHWQRDRRRGAEVPTTEGAGALAVRELIDTFRARGHTAAHLDPLADRPGPIPSELDPASHGLSVWDLERSFSTGGLGGTEVASLATIVDICRAAYCGTIGAEFMYCSDPTVRAFFAERLERPDRTLPADEARHVLGLLSASEAFERFLHARYVGQRRFSLEGGEAAIAFLDAVLEEAAAAGSVEAVIGMAHRGRLNTLANIVGKPFAAILADFEGTLDPTTVEGAGDVKYHKGGSGTWIGRSGATLPVTMASNPSHLEAVDPVVEGMARAMGERLDGVPASSVLPILVHGDASMAGQGVVAETFNLSALPGYETGGTVHLVINNQIGFTTPPSSARSSRYATDVAKMVEAPVLHVNGDDADAVVFCAKAALAYRETFHNDVVVDLVCYRLLGHNEGDDPSYTQPLIYETIEHHPTVRQIYAATLARRGVVTVEEADDAYGEVTAELTEALAVVRRTPPAHLDRLPEPRPRDPVPLSQPTGVDAAVLDRIAARLHRPPPGFHVHPKLERQLLQRAEQYRQGSLDWALAEALAFGSLLLGGTDIRLAGQDSRRGTFSQRHAVLVDHLDGSEYTPLAELERAVGGDPALPGAARPGRFTVLDSVLSEYAGLGFEYGYSLENGRGLVLWEAQFGDFANGAQIIIDNFMVAAEEKWGQLSGLVLLLPHGYEGQGPEHSSARMERYLSLSAAGNISVVQPTSAAQYFHLLRAQAAIAPRRPLVVITPKSLLRLRPAHSPVSELIVGRFEPVLDDPDAVDPDAVSRVLVCSGKIAYDVLERRGHQAAGATSAVVRVEQLAPWPADRLAEVLERYRAATELLWVQDEPENMGAWSYVEPRLSALVGDRLRIAHISRRAAGSPATGSHHLHDLELEQILDDALGAAAGA